MSDGDHFAERFGQHPAIIVVCADLAQVHPTDSSLGRVSIVGGASVYPMAQNLCLALRDQGVGTALTTLLVAREPEVKELLGIPDHYSTACHITAGYPARPSPASCTGLRPAAWRSPTRSGARWPAPAHSCTGWPRTSANKASSFRVMSPGSRAPVDIRIAGEYGTLPLFFYLFTRRTVYRSSLALQWREGR